MIDTTTVNHISAAQSLRRLANAAMQMPGVRVAVASFAGITPGQFPRIIEDVHQESAPDDDFVSETKQKTTRRLQACLSNRLYRENTARIEHAITQALGADVRQSVYSEIVYALKWAARDAFPALPSGDGKPFRIIVYSDGDQHGRGDTGRLGQTFYDTSGKPRAIDATRELAIMKAQYDGTAPTRNFDLFFVGLGLQPENQAAFASPEMLEVRKKFWTETAKFFGARSVYIGPELSEDVLSTK